MIEKEPNYTYVSARLLCDALRHEAMKFLGLAETINARLNFEATFMLSALKGHGVKDFLDWASSRIPEGPWHFPEDQLTDLTLALTAGLWVGLAAFSGLASRNGWPTSMPVTSSDLGSISLPKKGSTCVVTISPGLSRPS